MTKNKQTVYILVERHDGIYEIIDGVYGSFEKAEEAREDFMTLERAEDVWETHSVNEDNFTILEFKVE